jgi:hypothetical protein
MVSTKILKKAELSIFTISEISRILKIEQDK